MFQMSAPCVNTGTQMLSPFVDSSVDNVLLQTNADFEQSLLQFTDILKQRHVSCSSESPDAVEQLRIGGVSES